MRNPVVDATAVRFGEFEFELKTGELRRGQTVLKLQPQPAKILAILISRAGQMVTRQELAETVWGSDTFVDFDQGLNFAIRQIRIVLDDVADQPKFVVTVHRKGYRFIAPLEVETRRDAVASLPDVPTLPVPQTSQEKGSKSLHGKVILVSFGLIALTIAAYLLLTSRLRSHTSHPVPVLVVLPLQNLSGDPSQEYFADGITDELTTQLAKLRSVRVISRTSAMTYKATKKSLPDITRELNVDFVVEGSVVRSGEKLKLTVQLIDASSDHHLWAESYEDEVGDVLSIQKRVALQVASGIQGGLEPDEKARFDQSRPVNPQAYEDCARGRFFWNRRTEPDLAKALTYFQKAVQEDAGYAPAYAGLAEVYLAGGAYATFHPNEAYGLAKQAAQKAIELDATLSEAYVVLGVIAAEYDWDQREAEKQFIKAIALSPSNPRARQFYAEDVLEPQARFKEANRELSEAQELDPAQLMPRAAAGFAFYLARDYDRAVIQERKTLELDSRFPKAHQLLGLALLQQGKYDQAVQEFESAASLDSNPSYEAALAYAEALRGHKKRTQEILDRLQSGSPHRYIHPYLFVFIYSALGDREKALQWLERAEKERCWFLLYLNVEPRLDPLRSEPRFQALPRRVLGTQ